MNTVRGQANQPAFVIDGALDGLADPRRCVSRKLAVFLRVEQLNGAAEPESGLLEQVGPIQVPRPPSKAPDQGQAQPEVSQDDLVAEPLELRPGFRRDDPFLVSPHLLDRPQARYSLEQAPGFR